MPNEKSLFVWRVRCINRTTKEFFDRDMVLDQSSVPADEMPHVMRILKGGKPGGSTKHEIINYRRYFRELPPDGLKALNWEAYDHTDTFCLPEYFEDEKGNPLTTLGMMQAKAGTDDIIVLGDLESVLRFGPTDMANPADWTVEKANILTHFLEVVDCLAVSEFMRTESGYTQVVSQDGTRRITRFDRPNVFVVNAVLAFVRQLISKRDNLFGKAVETYLAHCSHDGKRLWMNHCKHMLAKSLDSRPFPIELEGFTGMKLLKLFFYAFGLLHHPEQDQIDEFRDTVAKCGREKLTGAFYFTCVSIVSDTFNAGQVIRQDLAQWLANGHAKPERVGITDLLGKIEGK